MALLAPPPRALSWRFRASLVVRAVHVGVVVFFMLGWMAPWRGALWAVLVGALLTQLNWWVTHNRCVLTMLEEWLRDGSTAASSGRDTNFVARLMTSLTGRVFPNWLAHVVAYVVLWFALIVSAVRLLT